MRDRPARVADVHEIAAAMPYVTRIEGPKGNAIYQVGGTHWREGYPILRDWLVASQKRTPGDPEHDGAWADYHRLHGTRGRLWGTAVGCLILAIPNRYLPILQEGKIDSVASQFGER